MKKAKKIQMNVSNRMTFEQGCKEYLDNCRARNLRDGTITHYTDTITQLYKYIDREMFIEEITMDVYDQFIRNLRSNEAMKLMTVKPIG